MPETRRPTQHSIKLRIYEIRTDGTRADLPLAPPGPVGACGIEGCTCLKARR